MTPSGRPGGLQQLQREVGGDRLGGGRLPEHGVAHQRRRGRQVAGDGAEVERGDRVDEALERPVLDPVPDAGGGDRLVGEDLRGEVHVEAQEVDQLAGGVDLGLVGRLRLAQHRGGGDRLAPGPGQQVGGAQEHRGPLVEGQVAPGRGAAWRGLDGVGDVGVGGVGVAADHRGVPVRLDDVVLGAGAAAAAAADHLLDVQRLGGELGQLGLQPRPLGAAGCVVVHRLVGRGGHDGGGVHGSPRGGRGECLHPTAAVARSSRPAGRTPGLVFVRSDEGGERVTAGRTADGAPRPPADARAGAAGRRCCGRWPRPPPSSSCPARAPVEVGAVVLVDADDLARPGRRRRARRSCGCWPGCRRRAAADWLPGPGGRGRRAAASGRGAGPGRRPAATELAAAARDGRRRPGRPCTRRPAGSRCWPPSATCWTGSRDGADARPPRGPASTPTSPGLAQTVSTLTRGMVSIEDEHARVLAYSASDDAADELRRLSILGRAGPPDYLERLRGWGVYDRLRRSDAVVEVPADAALGLRRRLAVSMRDQPAEALPGSGPAPPGRGCSAPSGCRRATSPSPRTPRRCCAAPPPSPPG